MSKGAPPNDGAAEIPGASGGRLSEIVAARRAEIHHAGNHEDRAGGQQMLDGVAADHPGHDLEDLPVELLALAASSSSARMSGTLPQFVSLCGWSHEVVPHSKCC